MICLLFTSNDVIPGKHNKTAYSVEFWHPIAQQHIGIMINVEIGS